MKICIVPICFNAHDDALRLLDSVDLAYRASSGIDLKVILSDNSTIAPSLEISHKQYAYSFQHLRNENIGYFPAFNKALSTIKERPDAYDFVIVCNVDLVVAEDFFVMLLNQYIDSDTGVLAPGIFSDRDGRDLNPKMMRRPSLAKIQFMRFICSNVLLFRGYHRLVHLRERIRSKSAKKHTTNSPIGLNPKSPKMYGAHGSFLIFTRNYFLKGAHLSYPRFLFGEEGFVAEQLRTHSLSIEHLPHIRVFDKEHASTSKAGMSFICGEHKKSYDYFYANFLKKKA
jgi:GT2 family glycosyltransferase